VKVIAEPVSIEVKLQELKKNKEDAAKPVFLTKEQRQKKALERLEVKFVCANKYVCVYKYACMYMSFCLSLLLGQGVTPENAFEQQ